MSQDSRDVTPLVACQEVVELIEKGAFAHYNKAVVILLDDKGYNYQRVSSVAGMSAQELVALFEIAKADAIQEISESGEDDEQPWKRSI